MEAGVLPPGRYVCSPRAVRRAFVDPFSDSHSRAAIYREWRSHRAALRSLAPVLYQWIDGSFVTDKLNPGDIDVVTFVDGPAFDKLPAWRQDVVNEICNGPGDMAYSRVDCKICPVYPSTDLSHSLYGAERKYWDDAWSRFQPGAKKGYVEVP